MNKPILFHDIDGVLFGEYQGEFQLRPGVKTWLKAADQHFEIVWLTTWPPEKIKALLGVIYSEKFIKNLPDLPVQCANWMHYSSKVVWLSQAIPKLNDREWFWIDDEVEALAGEIEALGVPKRRCIQVSKKGPDALRKLSMQFGLVHGD